MNDLHKHHFICTDIPGLFYCSCGAVSKHNRDLNIKVVVEDLFYKDGELHSAYENAQ